MHVRFGCRLQFALAAQVRLLRVLQEHQIERVGGHDPIHVDVRIIAATHRDLATMVHRRSFREDLWYRINLFPIRLPTLAERAEDIPEMANQFAKRARAGHTLNTTALVHEAYLKLTGTRSFESNSHFLRAAGQAMRRILVDHARARLAEKRGGGRRVEADLEKLVDDTTDSHLDSLDEALERLASQYPQQTELVQLRYFGGLTLDQCTFALGMSAQTADCWWAYARAWLSLELNEK